MRKRVLVPHRTSRYSGLVLAAAAVLLVAATAPGAVTFTIDNVVADEKGEAALPLAVALGGADVYSVDLAVAYDDGRLMPASVAKGLSAGSMLLEFNSNEPGILRVAMAGAQPVAADGTLLLITFEVIDCFNGSTVVSLREVMVNEDAVTAVKYDGTVSITGCFVRGDVNADGRVDLSDPIFTLLYLFQQDKAPPCRKAADVDDSGSLQIGDAVNALTYLFGGGPPPPPPFGGCGIDPTPDELPCTSFEPCS